MGNRTYFHTEYEGEANRENLSVPLQVNCTGEVNRTPFANRSVRRDFYYIYVTRGKLLMEELCLEQGDVIVISPGKQYQYQSQGDTAYLWVHFTGWEAAERTRKLFEIQQQQTKDFRKLHVGMHGELVDCFERLFREFIMNDQASQEITVCLLRELLALTERFAASGDQKLPLTALEYIHRHFRENLDVDALADMEHVSPTTFRILFKKHTGSTPGEYIIAQRLSEACRMLAETEESVRNIAAQVGYGDPYYFSRIFHKKMGTAPLKYRYQYQNLTARGSIPTSR